MPIGVGDRGDVRLPDTGVANHSASLRRSPNAVSIPIYGTTLYVWSRNGQQEFRTVTSRLPGPCASCAAADALTSRILWGDFPCLREARSRRSAATFPGSRATWVSPSRLQLTP